MGCEVWHKVITRIRIEEEGEMDIVWHHETKGNRTKKPTRGNELQENPLVLSEGFIKQDCGQTFIHFFRNGRMNRDWMKGSKLIFYCSEDPQKG